MPSAPDPALDGPGAAGSKLDTRSADLYPIGAVG
jgi:hypothetical protein